MFRRLHLTLILAALVVSVSMAAAQTTTGTITGRVTDSTGAVLPGVTLELTNMLTQLVRSSVSNESGDFIFSVLPPGQYSVRAELPGFTSIVRPNVAVQVNSTTRLELTLDPGTVAEAIEVTGEAPMIQTESAEVGAVMSGETITALPLNQRNFIQLVALEPGAHSVVKVPGGGTHFIQDIGGGGYSVHGMSANATEFLYDGMNMRDMIAGQVGINPTVDSIMEFKFQSSNYSAAFGGVAGGLVNISSKGGTNQFRGSAWEFFRDNRLDSRNYFDTTESVLRRNQFGGTLGGPIKRDKVFIFGSYEGLRRRKGVSNAITVPTQLQRQGNFSETPGAVVRNPFTGVPYPGNIIPASEIDAVGQATMERLFPEPNRPGLAQNLQTMAVGTNTSDQFNVRVDYNRGHSDLFFARYSQQDADNIIPWGSFTAHPDKFLSWANPAKNAVISHTRVFGANLVNEARVGYNWFNNYIVDVAQGTDFAGELGITGLSRDPFLWATPGINLTGYAGSGTLGNVPNERNNHTWKVWDNVTLIKGNHSLATGFSYVRYQQNGGAHSNAMGSFTFDGRFSANPIADLLLGLPASSARCCVTGTAKRYFRKSDVGIFLQDDWKVNSNLTLNMGVRWDFYGAVYEKYDRYNRIDMTQAPNLVIETAGGNGVPRGLRDPYMYNFAPRIGAAYAFPDGVTAIRGGFGMFYNSETYYIWSMNTNPPFTDRLTITSAASTPGLITLANPFPAGLGTQSSTYGGVAEDFRDPLYKQWNFDFQRQLGWGLTLSATYVGNKGDYLNYNQELNVPPSFQPGAIQPRRPIPTIAGYSERRSVARSWYHGVEFKARKQASSGLYFNVSYTRSKAEDEGGTIANGQGAIGSLKDPFTRDDDRGYATYDIPNRFTASFVYPFPFGAGQSGVLAGLVRDWTVQGIVLVEDGNPFTVNLPGDPANNGTSGLPDVVPGQDPDKGPKTAQQWYNKAAFQPPAPGTYGNSRRNSVRGPNFRSVDVALQRTFRLLDTQKLTFRGEVFNLFNRVNFLQPSANFGTPAEGTISGALDPRQVQLSLRFEF